MIPKQTGFTVEPMRESFLAEKTKAWHSRIHPYYTKQPSNVVSEYIKHFCPIDGLVLDPFCGTGVTAIEALSTGNIYNTSNLHCTCEY